MCVRRAGDGNGTRVEVRREMSRVGCLLAGVVGVEPDLTGGSFYILWRPTPCSGMLLAGYTHWR